MYPKKNLVVERSNISLVPFTLQTSEREFGPYGVTPEEGFFAGEENIHAYT